MTSSKPDTVRHNRLMKKVNQLISQMTLREKVCQLRALEVKNFLQVDGTIDWQALKREIKHGVGHLCNFVRHYEPGRGVEFVNRVQAYLKEHTRMGIPALIHDETLHGLRCKRACIFPQSIGLGASWDPALVHDVAATIGHEARSRGVHQGLAPTIDIALDKRCGRVEETYGEDPFLTSQIAVAYVKGIQSHHVIATPKHFVANFVGDGGRDSAAVHLSERLLREVHFPAYKAAVEEDGAMSIMSAYHSLDGRPCTANAWLLTDILREEWGFKGAVVSDYTAVQLLHYLHHTAETLEEAAVQALEAGCDMEVNVDTCFRYLEQAVERGRITEEVLDTAVRRTLYSKFWAGLFDCDPLDADAAETLCDCQTHRNLAYQAACKSMVLLKNEDLLPFSTRSVKKLAVIGPHADEVRVGGYSSDGAAIVTILQGLQNRFPNMQIEYARGCNYVGGNRRGYKKALALAKSADVVILVVGNNSCAEDQSELKDQPATEGEARDRVDLRLPGLQAELIREVAAVNKKTAVVLLNGSAIVMEDWRDAAPAILEAWYPGEEGGHAVADTLFGKVNPAGRLPITFPKHTGQSPLYYHQ